MTRFIALMGTLSLVACSDNTGPLGVDAAAPDGGDAGEVETSVKGTVNGASFVAADAISTTATAAGFEFQGPSTIVMLSDFPNACSNQSSGYGVAGGQLVVLALASVDADGTSHPATSPRSFTVTASKPAASSDSAQVYYEKDGANCLKAVGVMATSGTVNITDVDSAGTVRGTFTAKLSTGEQVAGNFIAPKCSDLNPNRTPVTTCS